MLANVKDQALKHGHPLISSRAKISEHLRVPRIGERLVTVQKGSMVQNPRYSCCWYALSISN
jgi:hypothetical protein